MACHNSISPPAISKETDRQQSTTSTISSFEKIQDPKKTCPESGRQYSVDDVLEDTFSWTDDEEARVLRKVDLRVLGVFCLVITAVTINHSSLYVGLTDNLLREVRVSQADFDNGIMLERIAVLISEFPTQYLVLRFGFRTVFPPLIGIWGIITTCQALMYGKHAFLAFRFFVGLFEAGYYAGMAYYFSQFYKHGEISTRLAILIAVADASGILAHLLAAGILKMRGVLGRPGWFWIFILEGIVLFGVAIMSYFYVPRSPKHNETVIHAQPWLNDRERAIVVARIIEDDPLKGHIGRPERATIRDLGRCLADKKMWLLYLSGFLGMVSLVPVRQYFPLILRSIGFSTFKSNMLMIPASVLKMLTVWALARSSQYFDEKAWHCALAHFCAFPLFFALELLPSTHLKWERYTVTSLLIATPQYCPIVIAWLSQSSYSVKKRALSISTYVVFVMLGTIVAAQVYRPNDRPYYRKANIFLLIMTVITSVTFLAQKSILIRTNRKREEQWKQMAPAQQEAYKAETRAEEYDGNKRLDFRFST